MGNVLNYIPKFKAWDVLEHKMRFVQSIQYADDGYAETIFVCLVGGISSGYVNGESCYLLPFIGRCDKNGKEIYANDIVKGRTPKYLGDEEFFGRVFLLDGNWVYGFLDGRPPKAMWDDVEVVGTVYENPELLEVETDEDRFCPFCQSDNIELQENMGMNGIGWLVIQWECQDCEQLFTTWEEKDGIFKDSKGFYNSPAVRRRLNGIS